ncbi:DNA replication initiation control protein YabA [Lentibacillus sp.]|uniref:DNA replication initiation control protein YabA n=1 Tax=Lentibacillus sp. TaxID=1925746 RepID=UPI002B4B614B|nr:DNA replication initiation control protein YabA [Lentibacillus sp.]HLS08969.1 DNA replication initiation control protein YabA [Lentibacillus sp.]
MSKRQIFDQVSDMETQIGELYEQLGDLKGKLSDLLEEKHRLEMENYHLRSRLEQADDDFKENKMVNDTSNIPGEGYDNLARLYEEGFHICNVHFGTPRREEDCLFCLQFLSKTK